MSVSPTSKPREAWVAYPSQPTQRPDLPNLSQIRDLPPLFEEMHVFIAIFRGRLNRLDEPLELEPSLMTRLEYVKKCLNDWLHLLVRTLNSETQLGEDGRGILPGFESERADKSWGGHLQELWRIMKVMDKKIQRPLCECLQSTIKDVEKEVEENKDLLELNLDQEMRERLEARNQRLQPILVREGGLKALMRRIHDPCLSVWWMIQTLRSKLDPLYTVEGMPSRPRIPPSHMYRYAFNLPWQPECKSVGGLSPAVVEKDVDGYDSEYYDEYYGSDSTDRRISESYVRYRDRR